MRKVLVWAVAVWVLAACPQESLADDGGGECGGCDSNVLIQQSFSSLTVVQQNFLVQTGMSNGICSNIVELQMLTIIQQETVITTALQGGHLSSVEVVTTTEVQVMINIAVGLGYPVVGFTPVSCPCQASSLMQMSFTQLTIIQQTWLVQQGIINGITWSGIPALIALSLSQQSMLIREALIQSVISSIRSLSSEEKQALVQLAQSLGISVEINAAESEIVFVFEDAGPPPAPPVRVEISPGGIGVGAGPCFAGDAKVEAETGFISVRDLQSNPETKIKVMDNNGNAKFEPVRLWIHATEERAAMREVRTESGKSLTLSYAHMIYVVPCEGGEKEAKFAGKVKAGECVLVNEGDRFTIEKVTETTSQLSQGAYQFTTSTGNVVVDNVLASCYSAGEYETIQHYFFTIMYHVQKWIPSFVTKSDAFGQHPITGAMLAFHSGL